MACLPRAHLLVGGIGRCAACISNSADPDAIQLPKNALHTPKTTHAKHGLLKPIRDRTFERAPRQKMLLCRRQGIRATGQGLITAAGPVVEDTIAGDRAVVLIFPEWDAAGFVSERRRIPSRGRAEEDLQALMQELCDGPERSGAVSALPDRTQILVAFLDGAGEAAILDFSAELVVRHPGGSSAEAATLTSAGGILGIVLGASTGLLIHWVSGFPVSLPWWSFALGLGFSAGVGIVFGMLPAMRASRMDPIEALHHE